MSRITDASSFVSSGQCSAYKSLAAVHDCGIKPVDYPDLVLYDYHPFSTMKKYFAVDDLFDQQDKIFFSNEI